MKKLLLLAFLIIHFFPLFATHVAGGNFIVTQTGPNLFTIECKVYRDCSPGNAAMPTSLSVGIYYKQNNTLFSSITMTTPVVDSVFLGDSCFNPTGICLQEGHFTYSGLTIPDNPDGYYIQTELYARNNAIVNLNAPGSQGMTFYAEIPDPALAGMNSSPDFGTYPSDGYFCVNVLKQFDMSVTDPDGDSLVYSLVEPLGSNLSSNGTSPAPYTNVIWNTPTYSGTNMVGGSPPMSCNPATGIISAKPSTVGSFVIGFKIEEFRNMVKIGEVRRDIQYYSLTCDSCLFTGIASNEKSEVNVFPNPFESNLNLRNIKPNSVLSLFNPESQLVYTKYIKNETDFLQVDLSLLTSGLYILSIEDSIQRRHFKVIKQ